MPVSCMLREGSERSLGVRRGRGVCGQPVEMTCFCNGGLSGGGALSFLKSCRETRAVNVFSRGGVSSSRVALR